MASRFGPRDPFSKANPRRKSLGGHFAERDDIETRPNRPPSPMGRRRESLSGGALIAPHASRIVRPRPLVRRGRAAWPWQGRRTPD
ncbi:hypothetical protein B2G71_17795 [Novosphingobium sp. PC22D]|nr:hypothetical protein B2G71_17795 [Novosphingobium sp. PC22D]